MKKAILFERLIAIFICLIVPALSFAQPGPPDDTPIDGGVSLLLAAGVGYGVKKYRDAKKKSVVAVQEDEAK
jgi:hypothetical protein